MPKARLDYGLNSMPGQRAAFIQPMLLMRSEKLPEAAECIHR